VPRAVRLLHGEDLLAEDASVPRGGWTTAGSVRQCQEGDVAQRREQLHAGESAHEAGEQVPTGVRRRVPRLLLTQRKIGGPGNSGQGVQCDQLGFGSMRSIVLQSRPYP